MDALVQQQLVKTITEADDPFAVISEIRALLHTLSPVKAMPVDLIHWIPIDQIDPNDYNPNSVAKIEMGLLIHSILADGYTQPIVTIHNAETDRYVIVDGFHRYYSMKHNPEVRALTRGLLPVVVIDKSLEERMASTVRHNRARGKHSTTGMSSLVFQMLEQGMTDASICNELGMEPEELLRLKHITGFSKLFANTEYNRSWVARGQIEARLRYEESLKPSPAETEST